MSDTSEGTLGQSIRLPSMTIRFVFFSVQDADEFAERYQEFRHLIEQNNRSWVDHICPYAITNRNSRDVGTLIWTRDLTVFADDVTSLLTDCHMFTNGRYASLFVDYSFDTADYIRYAGFFEHNNARAYNTDLVSHASYIIGTEEPHPLLLTLVDFEDYQRELVTSHVATATENLHIFSMPDQDVEKYKSSLVQLADRMEIMI
jgi:hypothetical protein